MPEPFLRDILREAPRPPRRRRLWYFWPAFTFSGILAGAGLYSIWLDGAPLTGLVLLIMAGLLTMAVQWLEETR